MGLDVYVGSLTRYMTGEWETVVQSWARETGQDVQVIRTTPEPEDAVIDPEVVLEAITEWKNAIGEAIAHPVDWDERKDAPYFTDKPDWDSYGSVQVLAALVELGDTERPAERVSDWSTNPAWITASSGDPAKYDHLYFPELWLPADIPVVRASAPWGAETVIGSAPQLLAALEEVNSRSYCVQSEDRVNLAPSEGPFADAAKFGLAILLGLTKKSVDQRLPVKLDY